MRACIRACLAVFIVLVGSGGAWAGTVQVRFVHLASPRDTLDVEIEGERVAEGLRFPAASEHLLIHRGEYSFRVTRRGDSKPLVEGRLALNSNGAYTVALLGASEALNPLVLRENTRGARKKARVRFVHAATGHPSLKIVEPDVEEPLEFSKLDFGRVSPEKAVSPGQRWLEVRRSAGEEHLFDLRGINLKAGTNYTVFLVRGPRGSLRALPMVTALPRKARLRFVQLDAEAPAVDLYVNRRRVLERVPPGAVAAHFELPPGTYLLEVTRFRQPQWVLGQEVVTLISGHRYTVATSSDRQFEPNLTVLRDDRRVRGDGGQLRFGQLAPDLPAVDVAVRGGGPLVTGLGVNEGSGYLTLPAGTYELEVRVSGSNEVVLAIPEVEVEVGVNATYLLGGQARRRTLRPQRLLDIDERFRRGDVDRDGALTVTDAFRTLEHLFAHLLTPICLDAADYNDDGKVEVDDAVRLIEFLFEGGRAPLGPFPEAGLDPTPDRLPCTFGD